MITGIGGTGVVTIGAILGTAAHIEGKGVTVLDQLGMAQKGGAVISHVRIGATPEALQAVRLGAGGADLLLGCDLVVSASADALARLEPGSSRAIVNTHQSITGEFTRRPDLAFPANTLKLSIEAAAGAGGCEFVEATAIATALLGDSIATNMFMLGYAYQRGAIPIGHEAIERAIELNGAAVPMNLSAFRWGRRAAADPATIEAAVAPAERKVVLFRAAETLDDIVASRMRHLTAYQDATLAERYQALVLRVQRAEQAIGLAGLARAVALSYAKLLAYKDEYEVARLHTEAAFQAALDRQFEGGYRLRFHLAPPLIATRDPTTGHLVKREFGAWMLPLFRILARLKFLRGTSVDPFGYTEERRQERSSIAAYEALVDELLAGLKPANHGLAVRLAALAQEIKGFGHVKQARLQSTMETQAQLLAEWRNPTTTLQAAE
jgi:indolepyruvate ferredoxin oxidoreductase